MRCPCALVGSNRSNLTLGDPIAECAFGDAVTTGDFGQRSASEDGRHGLGAQFGRVRHAFGHGSCLHLAGGFGLAIRTCSLEDFELGEDLGRHWFPGFAGQQAAQSGATFGALQRVALVL